MFPPVVLISGGPSRHDGTYYSAEIYHPDRDSACVLPDLPVPYYSHTQDGSLLCGNGKKYCHRWNTVTGVWDWVIGPLIEKRLEHVSWTPADGSGTYLMGGAFSADTSEVISQDNSVNASLPLKTR